MTSLGGGYKGISPKQTSGNEKNSNDIVLRKIVTKSWNTAYATGKYNGQSRRIGPFRAINNSGDFLSRSEYTCGGSNQWNSRPNMHGLIIGSSHNNCDWTGVPASNTNPKFVADSSDYTSFRKQRSANLSYNDIAFVGPTSTYTQNAFGLWSMH